MIIWETLSDIIRIWARDADLVVPTSARQVRTELAQAKTEADLAAIINRHGIGRPEEQTADDESQAASDAKRYSKADLREMTALSDTSLTKYTKAAGVNVPPKGTKNHRYTVDEVHRILTAVCDETQDQSVKAKSKAELEAMQNPA